MATAAAADQASDLVQKLSLDAKSEASEAPVAQVKVSGGPGGKLNGVTGSRNPPLASTEKRGNPVPQDFNDSGMYYGAYPGAYYCPGWGDYSMYCTQEGVETPTVGAYGDMYLYPQYGGATPGHDGQMYGSQQYRYPSTYQQPLNTVSKPPYKSRTDKIAPSSQEEITAAAADPLHAVVSAPKATSNSIDDVKDLKKTTLPLKPNELLDGYQNQSSRAPYPCNGGQIYQGKHQRVSSGYPTSTASNPKNKVQPKNQNAQPLPLMGLHGHNPPMAPIYSGNGMYNNNAYGGFWYGSQFYGPGMYGGWNALSDGKYKPRGRTYGSYGYANENLDGLIELKRGPRSGLFKNQLGFGSDLVTPGQDVPAGDTSSAVLKPVTTQDAPDSYGSNAVLQDQYNQSDFTETYANAKFFIIKSYSEDDVHKSIKYNVWASTPNGNKKLDSAYLDAKEKSSNSPVFLLFSVNTSGQFVGLAEMVGQVDFNKTLGYWQQDKWTGCFPVKWHIVKDIPNNLLKHIILEYNENKPVTNSRDTQEVKLEQGLQVLKIFKDHICKTSILDDFGFYDNREKIMQERKSQRQHPLKKIMNTKLPTADNTKNEAKKVQGLQKSEIAEDENPVMENGAVAVASNGAGPKVAN